MWKIGEVAKRLGLTVRTLHHYDAIGLVEPSARSDAGYRLYSDEDAARLAHVALLRRLGMSLEDIRACVDAQGADARDAISRHIDALRTSLEEQHTLLRRLESIEAHIAAAPHAGTSRLDAIMEAVKMVEEYYTPEQLEQLAQRKEALGADAIEDVQREWAQLFEGFGAALTRGASVDEPDVQALARRARELTAMFTGGDAGIERSLNTMYEEEGAPKVLQSHDYGVDAELWEYMGKARAALED